MRRRLVVIVSAVALLFVLSGVARPAKATSTTTYSATETIPVPPASVYAGTGDGDGWAVALSATQVFNVFHHSGSLTVACHQQSDASDCWSPETITDPAGDSFATSGQPGLWLDQQSGRLYVYATRSSDSTAGVVCIDTTQGASSPDPFCGFTALSNPGDAPTQNGISAISNPVLIGSSWFAFNYVNGQTATGTRNVLMCFDVGTLGPCTNQPYYLNVGAGPMSSNAFPPPAVTGIGTRVIVPFNDGGPDELACFDATVDNLCSGSWPITLSAPYNSASGAAFPMLDTGGTITGLCLPDGTDPCFDLSGNSVPTPANMPSAVTQTSGWDGPALVIGERAYVPNGNADSVDCFDYATQASCSNFPLALSGLGLLYTVNADPQRPSCIWVNSDDGPSQIQNFDAYGGNGCGQGPIRVLATSLVAPGQQCTPYSYTSLQVLQPQPSSYSSGTVGFEDGDGNPIPGATDETLDSTGSVSLSQVPLNSGTGLPQFLITLNGVSSTPSSVQVKLTWTGLDDTSCIPVDGNRYVALGDSIPYGHGLSNPYTTAQINQLVSGLSQGPSTLAYPSLVAKAKMLHLSVRKGNCTLTGDQLAISGAPATAADSPSSPPDPSQIQCDGQPRSVLGEVTASQIGPANPSGPAALVTLQVGADDIDFADCLKWEASEHLSGTQCVANGQVTKPVSDALANLGSALDQILSRVAPNAVKVMVIDYYDPIPSPSDFKSPETALSANVDPVCAGIEATNALFSNGPYNDSIVIQSALNNAIIRAVDRAHAAGMSNVELVDIQHLMLHHEMCTSSPALFAGEAMPRSEFWGDLGAMGASAYCHAEFGVVAGTVCKFADQQAAAAQEDLTKHAWRAAHPNTSGQQDIANSIEGKFS